MNPVQKTLVTLSFALSLTAGPTATAQINLDKPVMAGAHDQIYESAGEPGWYYFFPRELCRVSAPRRVLQGVRLFADFSVSLCNVQIEKVKQLLIDKGIANPQVRVFRGLNASTTAMSLQDVYGSFDPKIEVLGDAGAFGEPIGYRIGLYAGTRNRSIRRAQNVMNTLFGENSIDAYIQVQYYFSSIVGGQLRESNSAVSVYVARGPMNPNPAKASFWPVGAERVRHQLLSTPLSLTEQTETNGITVLEDSLTRCWNKPTPGIICVR